MCSPSHSIFNITLRHSQFLLNQPNPTSLRNVTRAVKAVKKAEPPSLFFMSTPSIPSHFPPISIIPAVEAAESNMEVETPVQNSPEFEFWMVRNPSFPPPNLLTADELFLDGVLLPLQLLSLPCSDRPVPVPTNPPGSPAEPTASILYSSASISRRWKDLFKSTAEKKPDEKDRRKKLHRITSADVNINLNIWPFTRSRSAVGRPHSGSFVGSRKVSSAPCSRSNSNGESNGGMRLRRGKEKERLGISAGCGAEGNGGVAGVRVLKVNVNSCVGYGSRVSSPGEDREEMTGGGRTAEGGGGGGGSMFNLRGVFSKKVVL